MILLALIRRNPVPQNFIVAHSIMVLSTAIAGVTFDGVDNLLLRSAARLYSLGVDLEGAKEHLQQLVDAGVGYEAPEMMQTLNEYIELKKQWDNLEAEHLMLRNELAL